MKKNLRFVSLDVHQDSIAVAVADTGREPARLLETIDYDLIALVGVLDRQPFRKLVRKTLTAKQQPLR